MSILSNKSVPIDAPKMEFLLNVANITPSQKTSATWQDCFIRFSLEANDIFEHINAIKSLSWVKHSIQYLNS